MFYNMSSEQKIPPESPKGPDTDFNKENAKEHFPEDRNTPALPTPNTQSQPDNMEVHHHSHAHGKKNRKAYFWEFLMLFLAVFCGSLAEYQLEHKIEKERERQFIGSLINDIATDTVSLESIIHFRERREKRMDSLTFLLNNDASKTGDIYFHAIYVTRNISIRFVPSDGTIQQLKNSGGFRLIRNRKVADSISSYDVAIRNLLKQAENETEIMHSYYESAGKKFDGLVFDRMLDENNLIIRPKDNPPLAPFSVADLREFNYTLYPVKSINKATRREEKIFLKKAQNLLALLKKEYDIK